MQHAINPIPDNEELLPRLDMHIRRACFDGLGKHIIDQLDDRSFLGQLKQTLTALLAEQPGDGQLLTDKANQSLDLVSRGQHPLKPEAFGFQGGFEHFPDFVTVKSGRKNTDRSFFRLICRFRESLFKPGNGLLLQHPFHADRQFPQCFVYLEVVWCRLLFAQKRITPLGREGL